MGPFAGGSAVRAAREQATLKYCRRCVGRGGDRVASGCQGGVAYLRANMVPRLAAQKSLRDNLAVTGIERSLAKTGDSLNLRSGRR